MRTQSLPPLPDKAGRGTRPAIRARLRALALSRRETRASGLIG